MDFVQSILVFIVLMNKRTAVLKIEHVSGQTADCHRSIVTYKLNKTRVNIMMDKTADMLWLLPYEMFDQIDEMK